MIHAVFYSTCKLNVNNWRKKWEGVQHMEISRKHTQNNSKFLKAVQEIGKEKKNNVAIFTWEMGLKVLH